jgi:ketosteroid isomerase-like protein
MSTEAILTHHLQAIPQGVDQIMTDYTEESVLFTQNGPLKGLAAIRQFFDNFVSGAPPELIQAITVTRQDVHGEVAYIVWHAAPFIPLATDTFVVRDDKILAQTFAMLAPPSPAA